MGTYVLIYIGGEAEPEDQLQEVMDRWMAWFGRLGAARAARAVGSATDLGEALGDLLSPDRAARLAQAAWAVASDGAEVTDRVMDLIRRTMDGEA